ncbi:hypothetical protein [Streptomyces sp. NPDC016845]|uniref:hypothetical protein n=1 Tax=Streptomyces sp. NPDC016845 TaxID=3364972 RepID=UPI00379DD125
MFAVGFRTPWLRAAVAALACAVLTGPAAGCGGDGGGPRTAGEILTGRTDGEGRPYRQVPEEDAPEIGVVVQPDGARPGGWDVRIRVRHFRLSPEGTPADAVRGRGYARLFLDSHPLARLRTTTYRLPPTRLARGTHHLTARLYADDHTVWAVDGEPVEATADLTASDAEPFPGTSPDLTASDADRSPGAGLVG